MGFLEDTLTEHHRMAERDTKIKQLTAEVAKLRELKTPATRQLLNITKGLLDNAEQEVAKLRAALEEIADDPGGNPPQAVVDDMRETARAALSNASHIIAGPDECDSGVALTQAINETIAEDDADLTKETK